MARFDLIHKFAYVRELTPRYLPYYEGVTYQYMLIGWIPRIFWPDKPVASDSNQVVDVDYGFKFRQQTGTNIGIGQSARSLRQLWRGGHCGADVHAGPGFWSHQPSVQRAAQRRRAGDLYFDHGVLPQRHRLVHGYLVRRVGAKPAG